MTASFDPGHGPGAATWTYGLGDLTSFTYETAGIAGLAPLFQLTTDSINGGPGGYIYPGAITIAGVLRNQVTLTIDNGTAPLATGTLSSAPEPAAAWLIVAAGGPLLLLLPRRKKA